MLKKSYSKLLRFPTFEERFEYLKLQGMVGNETFGSSRYLNQEFYHSEEWASLRDSIIIRDDGCDLGIPDRPIRGRIYVHHINPIDELALVHGDDSVWDPENLICTSFTTHNAIHYGDASSLYPEPIDRHPNDTCPWKGGRL